MYLVLFSSFLEILTKEEFQIIVAKHPTYTDQDFADLHLEFIGIQVGDSTINEKLHKWNIKKMSKDEYYRVKTLEFLKKGCNLKKIYTEAFNLKRWYEHSSKFFRRVFKDDPVINKGVGPIKKRIEGSYKS